MVTSLFRFSTEGVPCRGLSSFPLNATSEASRQLDSRPHSSPRDSNGPDSRHSSNRILARRCCDAPPARRIITIVGAKRVYRSRPGNSVSAFHTMDPPSFPCAPASQDPLCPDTQLHVSSVQNGHPGNGPVTACAFDTTAPLLFLGAPSLHHPPLPDA